MTSRQQQALENVYHRASAPTTLLYQDVPITDITTGQTTILIYIPCTYAYAHDSRITLLASYDAMIATTPDTPTHYYSYLYLFLLYGR